MPHRITFGKPETDDVSFLDVNRRNVYLDGGYIGLLHGTDPAPGNEHRPTRFVYEPADGRTVPDTYDRLETAREGIDRLYLGEPARDDDYTPEAIDRDQAEETLTPTRISDRLFTYMTGSQAYYDRTDWPEAHDLIKKIEAAKARKDGSVHLRLTEDERSIVLDYADWFANAASDDAGPDNTDALADYNSGRATFNRLYREGVRSKPLGAWASGR